MKIDTEKKIIYIEDNFSFTELYELRNTIIDISKYTIQNLRNSNINSEIKVFNPYRDIGNGFL